MTPDQVADRQGQQETQRDRLPAQARQPEVSACPRARPSPIIGVINGARSIEPITTAGEFCISPSEAIADARPNMPTKSGPQTEPCTQIVEQIGVIGGIDAWQPIRLAARLT